MIDREQRLRLIRYAATYRPLTALEEAEIARLEAEDDHGDPQPCANMARAITRDLADFGVARAALDALGLRRDLLEETCLRDRVVFSLLARIVDDVRRLGAEARLAEADTKALRAEVDALKARVTDAILGGAGE